MEFLELTEEEFRNYLNKSEERTFLQTPEIGKLREKSGWTVSYLGVKNKGEVVAAAMFTSITRHFGKKEFYAPRGLLLDYSNQELLAFFTENIKKYVMKTFEIEVNEILSRVICIDAESQSDALLKVKEMYRNEEIVLDADDYIETEIMPFIDEF